MSDFLLTQIINFGAPILAVIVFLGGVGVPMPGTLLVIAAGAFARQGLLTWYTAALSALLFVIIGDSLSYAMGHFLREPVLKRFSHSEKWNKAESTFNRWGGLAIFWTRFLLTTIAVPVNLIAGTSGFGFRRFLFWDVIGETIWIFGYGGLGYLFGTQWEVISNFLNNISGLAFGIIILVVGIWLGIRRMKAIEAKKANVTET